MKRKFGIKSIVLAVVAAVLAVVLVAGNIILDKYSLILNRFFAGDTVDTDNEETKDALVYGDQVVQEAAEESFVLLKNDGFLPVSNLSKVNLFGWGSTDNGLLLTGGGSGGTTITDNLENGDKRIKIDLTDALKAASIEYNTALYDEYVKFSSFDADSGSTGSDATKSLLNPSASFYTEELMSSAKAYSDTAIVVLSRWGVENGGNGELKNIGKYSNGTFLELTSEEKAMLDKLESNSFNVIVLLNVCNNMELGFIEDYGCIRACLHIGIPGQSGLAALPKILKGEVSPSGRTSDTLAYDYQTNNPTYVNAVKSNSDIAYQEGIYYGYKWYETAGADGYFDSVSNSYGSGYDGVVQFPFGYGLSYTSFKWEVDWGRFNNLEKDGEYKIKVKVKNTGAVDGKDVVQLYGHAPYIEGGIEKAERVLLDFVKTPLIPAGETREVELSFTTYDIASYDDYDKNGNGFRGYELDEGKYIFSVMENSHDSVADKEINLKTNIRFDKDPHSGNDVVNRFTDYDSVRAYAECPVDGSTAYGSKIDYLSRANLFANMPSKQVGASSVGNAPNYRHTDYDSADISDIKYGIDAGMYLVQVESPDSTEENPVYEKATLKQLDGSEKDVKLAYNKELLTKLSDYNSEDWIDFLNQLTEAEVKELIGNAGFQTIAAVTIGKPRCMDKDGPAGFNNNVTNPGKSSKFTLYPSESLLGCSWSKDIMAKIGKAQGKIGTTMGVNGWYGPGVNLHRNNYNSRNYEYFSEDGVLSGVYAAEIIRAAKDNNLYCYLKHFAVSEEGQNPRNVNTWLTEQNLRENYLKPFEIAVKRGGGNGIMTAFNRVGAVLAVYNHAMLNGVLRGEWGFKGSVITDWYTGGGYAENQTLGVLGGNNLWLCGSTGEPAKIDLKNTAVAYAARQAVKNIIYTYVDTYITATTIKVNAEASSPMFIAMWVIANVLLVAGMAACITFIVLPVLRDKKAAEQSLTEAPSEKADE